MKDLTQITATVAAETVTVVSIDPSGEDKLSLERIFNHWNWALSMEPKWLLQSASTLERALNIIRDTRSPIVLSECDLAPGSWKDVLARLSTLPDPPSLIVASRFADDRLWAEALNLGAYDVLTRPFDSEELLRVLGSAWIHQQRRLSEITGRRRSLMTAAAG